MYRRFQNRRTVRAEFAVCIGFIANEVLSIVENAGLMGVPMPSMIKKAVDMLKDTAESGTR